MVVSLLNSDHLSDAALNMSFIFALNARTRSSSSTSLCLSDVAMSS